MSPSNFVCNCLILFLLYAHCKRTPGPYVAYIYFGAVFSTKRRLTSSRRPTSIFGPTPLLGGRKDAFGGSDGYIVCPFSIPTRRVFSQFEGCDRLVFSLTSRRFLATPANVFT